MSSERKLLQTLLTAALSMSTTLHELEAKGVELSTSQNNKWELATVAMEMVREHFKKEKKNHDGS